MKLVKSTKVPEALRSFGMAVILLMIVSGVLTLVYLAWSRPLGGDSHNYLRLPPSPSAYVSR